MDEFARPVAYLNPKPGSPTVADSHVGGPLLWPAGEPWPWCDGAEPVRATEYAMAPDRPESLRDEEWPEVPHGSKAAGWTCWYNALPREMECPECGSVRRQTLGLGGGEPSGHTIGWDLGRQANLNVFTCPRDVRHPIKVNCD